MPDDDEKKGSRSSNVLFKIYYSSAIFLLASGSILIGLCSLWESATKQYNYLLDVTLRVEVYILLGLGVLLILLGILGIFSAMSQSYCLLGTYSALLTLTLIVKVVIGIVLAVYGTNPSLTIGRNLILELRKCEHFSEFFNMFYQYQEQLSCCGVGGPEDYKYQMHCWSRHTDCYLNRNYYWGCADAISNAVSYYSIIVAGFALGSSIIEAVGCILACTLTIWVKKQL